MLDREESIEQAYFFRVLRERLPENMPLQDLLAQLRQEVLATTKLPMAIDFLLSELKLTGLISSAMKRLAHYFRPFQTYLVSEAENDRSRFDMRVALEVLEKEADYRAKEHTPAGVFLYQFETICRNRLRYDHGLDAVAADPLYDDTWRGWIQTVRRQIGLLDLADMMYVASEHYDTQQARLRRTTEKADRPVLFGEKEGQIALANRRKDPLYLFAALQRHLGYPRVPRGQKFNENRDLVPQLMRRLERIETRLKLMEEEQREGIDITRFYNPKSPPIPPVEWDKEN
ncbi:MAG: hypothetical protein RIC55_19295 [Pirellulaceae bacterium]